jgi:hypothetical protein
MPLKTMPLKNRPLKNHAPEKPAPEKPQMALCLLYTFLGANLPLKNVGHHKSPPFLLLTVSGANRCSEGRLRTALLYID